jgi:hypothetical protein
MRNDSRPFYYLFSHIDRLQILLHIRPYMNIYICVCVCVCVSVHRRGFELVIRFIVHLLVVTARL